MSIGLGVVRDPASTYAGRVSARATLALAVLFLVPSVARAELRAYRGAHPVDLEGRWHLEEGAHVHDELPVGLEPFGDVDGVLVFLGDPAAYGWSGDVWSYRGAHPLPGGLAGYCGLAGAHEHPFAPEGSFRREQGGAYVFTGGMRGGLAMVRPRRVAPRHPVAAANPAGPPVGPYWLGGCLHTVVAGPGGPVPVPVRGCVPRPFARPARRAPSPPAPLPGALDGRYSRTDTRRPGVAPRPAARPVQRRDP